VSFLSIHRLFKSPPRLANEGGTGGISISLLGIAQICSWGSLYYSFPQIAEAISQELAFAKTQVYGALTLGLLLSAFAGLPFGSAIDRGLGKQVMTLGSLVAGLLLMLGSQLNSLLGFYVIFAALGFLHSATLYDAAFSVIANNFNGEDSRRHITTLTLWGGFAGTVFIPFIELLLRTSDWRTTMLVLGAINLIICASIYGRLPKASLVKKAKSQEKAPQKNKPEMKNQDAQNQGVRWALSHPMFWTLMICFAFFAATTTTFKFHLYPLLIEKGLSAQHVVAILAILGPSQVAGRVLLKLFLERISIIKLGVLTASVLPVVFIAFNYLPAQFIWLVPFAMIFGAATGTMTIVKGIAVPELLTRQSYGAINGAMNVPVKIIKALSPTLAALVWTITGSYAGLLDGLILLGAISALCFLFASLKTCAK